MTAIDTSTEVVERLIDGVTPGPWSEHDAGKHPYVFVCGPDQLYYDGEVTDKPLVAYVTGVGAIENRAFITAARDLIPALLKERDEARAALAASHPADPVTNAGSCQPVKIKPLKWEDFANISASPDDDAVMDDNLAVALCSYFDSRMDCPDDEEEGAELDDYGCWRVWVSENAEKVLRRIAKAANDHILAALEDAPHVNETPKSEHDSADVLAAIPDAVAEMIRQAVQAERERLALDHQAVGNNPDTLIMSHPHHWKTAAVLRQLVKERDEARAALAASHPADPVTNAGSCQPVRVKPLVWDGFVSGCYLIEVKEGGIANLWRYSAKMVAAEEPELICGGYLTLVSIDGLKAAAQADYEARILSAIEPAPVSLADALKLPEVRAMVEAANMGLKDLSAWLAIPHVGEMFNTDMTHFAVQELTAALCAIGEGEA